MANTIVHYTPAQNVTVKAAAKIEAGSLVEIATRIREQQIIIA